MEIGGKNELERSSIPTGNGHCVQLNENGGVLFGVNQQFSYCSDFSLFPTSPNITHSINTYAA